MSSHKQMNSMNRIRQHYQGYITDLLRKIEVSDRMFTETGYYDWLETYESLKEEVEALKTTVKEMERHNERYNNQASTEESSD